MINVLSSPSPEAVEGKWQKIVMDGMLKCVLMVS